MKITDIKCYPVNIATGTQLVVKVETDSGVYGWGASGLSGRELAVVGVIQHFRRFLIGKDSRKIGAIWQELYRGQYFEGGRVFTAAISAIDIALHDIKGKALGVPVYELLGGKQRERVECFASLRFTTKDELFDKAHILRNAGWGVLRLAPQEYLATDTPSIFEPRNSIALLAEWISELRREMGSQCIIGIDYHSRLTVAETVAFIERMPVGTIDFIEEPIRDENTQAYKNLRQMISTPFAIGEEFSSKWQFMPFLEQGITQFARIDVCNVGGLTEAMKVAAMAETHYIDLLPHNPLGPICTAATLHLAAACPNFAWLEEINTPAEQAGTNDPEFYPVQPQLDGACYSVPELPGLGVEFNESLAMQKEFQPVELPRLQRRDGSFTNW